MRYNVGLSNEGVAKTNWGFNLVYRWQDKVNWQGTFGAGEIDPPIFAMLLIFGNL